MRAAIAIDTWKKPIFEAALKKGAWEWTEGEGLTEGTTNLYVEYRNDRALARLTKLTRRCQIAARIQKIRRQQRNN